MDNYITLGARDAAEAETFYDAVFATLGWSSHMTWPGWRAYSLGGSGQGLTVWTATPFDGQPASVGNGTMVAIAAPTREAVDAFHAAALANGGRDEGAAGPRPDYGPDWYSAYVRDPTGNKLAAVWNG
jgi:catechol 2,3-dioxygenase-like lactoylglutathione lyase family enzyme